MNCSNCGFQLNPDERFCPDCGTPISAQQSQSQSYSNQYQAQSYSEQPGLKSFCSACGTELYNNDVFCPTCGRNLGDQTPPQASAQPPKKSQAGLIVAVVCLVVLALGALVVALLAVNNGNNDNNDKPWSVEETATPIPAPPVFTEVSATSTRGYDVDTTTNEMVFYYPSYAVDGLMHTAWTPDRKIDQNPILSLSADTKQYVTGIRMTNGYCKSQKTYTRNRRITKASILYEGGEKIVTFDIDNFGNLIEIYLDEPVYTNYISIKPLETYYGDWQDIAISEIEVF